MALACLALALVACGEAESDAVSGSERLPAEAPDCEERNHPGSFSRGAITALELSSDGPARHAGSRATFDGRVIDRGLGSPPPVELPEGFEAPQLGAWLLLEGTSSARRVGPGPREVTNTTSDAGWIVLGPSELAAVPLTADDELHIDLERPFSPAYAPTSQKLAASANGSIVFLDEWRGIDENPIESGGMVYARGAAICQTSDDCYYYYEHMLELQTPGGAHASLAPLEARDVGSYRVFHGATGSASAVARNIDILHSCADRAQQVQLTSVTTILRPSTE